MWIHDSEKGNSQLGRSEDVKKKSFEFVFFFFFTLLFGGRYSKMLQKKLIKKKVSRPPKHLTTFGISRSSTHQAKNPKGVEETCRATNRNEFAKNRKIDRLEGSKFLIEKKIK